jgi:glycerophosphoryl diester phosphodiesterase
MRKSIIAIILFLTIGCMHVKKINHSPLAAGSFDFEGHRGCRGLMPENTIPAYQHAIDLGVTTLEMDVVITKDKQVIMSHEPFFNHEITTKSDGSFVDEKEERSWNIYQMTYAETLQFDVGIKTHPRFPLQQKVAVHKPRLSDVIDSADVYAAVKNKHLPFYNIETKSTAATDNIYHPAPAEFVELIMQVIKEKKIEDRTIIQSFDIRPLQYLHEHYPSIKTSYLFELPSDKTFAERLKELGFLPTIYSPDEKLVSPLLVKQCRELGIKLVPWTINDIKRMKELKQMGVDGLISDFPDLYKQIK